MSAWVVAQDLDPKLMAALPGLKGVVYLTGDRLMNWSHDVRKAHLFLDEADAAAAALGALEPWGAYVLEVATEMVVVVDARGKPVVLSGRPEG